MAKSTAASKSAEIRKTLKISRAKAEWTLESQVGRNPFLWMITVNGLPVDARCLPPAMQLIAYQKGLIPYVPAFQEGQDEE